HWSRTESPRRRRRAGQWTQAASVPRSVVGGFNPAPGSEAPRPTRSSARGCPSPGLRRGRALRGRAEVLVEPGEHLAPQVADVGRRLENVAFAPVPHEPGPPAQPEQAHVEFLRL